VGGRARRRVRPLTRATSRRTAAGLRRGFALPGVPLRGALLTGTRLRDRPGERPAGAQRGRPRAPFLLGRRGRFVIRDVPLTRPVPLERVRPGRTGPFPPRTEIDDGPRVRRLTRRLEG